jgi:hypothetical protein
MTQQLLFKGRDKRKKGWFWMDNEYLNGYAKLFGPTGTAIYLSLCRHADNETQQCFPAEETIAEELNTTSRTIRTYINLFEKSNLISVSREWDNLTKKRKNNVYTLLDKEDWKKPEEIISYGLPRGNNKQKPEEIKDKNQRKPVPSKETHINNTHIKETQLAKQSFAGSEINDLIELFNFNPSYKKFYSNNTQRLALYRVLKSIGREKLEWSIKMLPKINKMQYAPVITTPIELENKLASLIAFLQKEKGRQIKNQIIKI